MGDNTKGCMAVIGVGFVIFVLASCLFLMQNCSRAVDEAANVAHEQFGASALLKKYECFKDVAAALDKKLADIQVYEKHMTNMKEEYAGKSRTEWTREDREQYNVWSSELAGVKVSYNGLAAEYNADMAKFNYNFTNVGDLPRGADKPLSREFKPYTVD